MLINESKNQTPRAKSKQIKNKHQVDISFNSSQDSLSDSDSIDSHPVSKNERAQQYIIRNKNHKIRDIMISLPPENANK